MEKLKNAWKKMKKKRLIAVILVVVLLIVLWRSCAGQNGNRASAADNQYLSATVDRGDITSSISASGTLEPADSYTVTTLSSGEILTADFEEGDQVTKGEVLYQVDSSDASSNLEKAQLTLEQAQRSYERALESQEDQNVKSTTAGTVCSPLRSWICSGRTPSTTGRDSTFPRRRLACFSSLSSTRAPSSSTQ